MSDRPDWLRAATVLVDDSTPKPPPTMSDIREYERDRLLDPVDRISEILFGLIMAVTIVGSLSVADAGRGDVKAITAAAIGCNLAWGLVDAIMYVVRTVTGRMRNRALVRRIVSADVDRARRLIADELPQAMAPLVGPAELDAMRERLHAIDFRHARLLRRRDVLEAVGIFLLVVLATFPVVIPFVLFDDVALAMRAAQGVAVAMLFLCGASLGRYAGHPRPLRMGTATAVFGVVLIGVVKALGG